MGAHRKRRGGLELAVYSQKMLNKLNLFTAACAQFTNTILSKFTHVPIMPAHGAINYNLNGYALVKRPWYGPDYQSEAGPEYTERTFTFEVAAFENSRDLLKFARELVRNVDAWEKVKGIEQIAQGELENFINVHAGANQHGCIVRWETTDEDKDKLLGTKDPDLIVVEPGTPEVREHYGYGLSISVEHRKPEDQQIYLLDPQHPQLPEAMLFEINSIILENQTPSQIAFYYPHSGELQIDTPSWGRSEPHHLDKGLDEAAVISWLDKRYPDGTVIERQKGSDIKPE